MIGGKRPCYLTPHRRACQPERHSPVTIAARLMALL
jgi:hypothetical protein